MKSIMWAAAGGILLPSLSALGGYRVLPAKTDVPYAKVEALAPVGMSLTNGVMHKNGRPHFWIGNGHADAASQQGHFGVWLAWLQGADAVTLNHGMKVNARRAADGMVEVWDEPDLAIQSWRREAVRLGLLCDFFHSHEPGTGGQTCTAEAYKLSLEDPELHEIYYHLGHHLGFDTGSDEGLAFSLAHRKALFDYLKQEPYTSYMEIAREPGANPSNNRVRRDFITWAKRKYGGDLAAADAVWGVKHESWDAVVPPHLDKVRFPAKHSYEDILVRNRARAEAPNFYADWRRFLEDDTTRMMERELSALRRLAPWAPVTVDVRGHTNRDDCYAAFVPERISPLVDLFSIHYGTRFFDYGGRAWERSCVLQSSDAPLMWESYFRVNTDGALVNSENIFGDARSAMQSAEQMRANDMGKLCAQKWRIAKEPGGSASRKWKEPDFDDSAWDEIEVPGCWDQAVGTAYEGYHGTCWLRRTFTVAGTRKQDFVDGSCVFKLIGKGVAQQGDVWLNGHRLNTKKVVGWSAPYEFDVGPFLNWGGRNVLAWRVEGMGQSDNGLRFPSYILTQDQLAKPLPFNERMCRFMSFGHLMGGLSGIWMWHWHADGVRSYMPRLKAQLNAVAEVALPEIRNRRGRVAYLYAFDNGPGLPFGGDNRHYVDYHDALVFCGANPDVFGEARFRRDVTPDRYPVLFVPMAPCVDAATYAHFKRYVADGGTAVVTDGTFLKTNDRYAPTDFAAYLEKGDFGKGRVFTFQSRLELGELMDRLTAILPPPSLRVTSRTVGEKPLIERILVGGAERKVLYFANWGGLSQELSVMLPPSLKDWNVTPVVGSFAKGLAATGALAVTVPSQDVAVALLSRPHAKVPEFPKVSPKRQARLDELAAWLARARATPCESADVVFVGASEGLRSARAQGIEKHPEILRMLDRLGLTYSEITVEGLKASHLAAAKLVILAESNSNCGIKADNKRKGPMVGILESFVRRGGALMLLADSAGSRNCDALSLRELAGRFGVSASRTAAYDEGRGRFGDPFQILSGDIPPSPLSEGVRTVQLYRLRPLASVSRKKRPDGVSVFPVVNVNGGAAVMAGMCGAGRFFISSDISMFAPLRIEHGDNAGLLANALCWLLSRPVGAEMRGSCRKGLFFTEADFKAILNDEWRDGDGDACPAEPSSPAKCAAASGDESPGTQVAFDGSLKGKRVTVTVEVENTGSYAVGNRLALHQFDAEGRRLMEDVCDPRFLSFMRPAGLRHAMTVEGSIHPKTAKIELVSKVFGDKPAWMDCADAAVKVCGVKIAALPERNANKAFFTEGVEGKALDLHDSRAFFFPVYSRACWGQGLTVKDPADLFYPSGEGTVEAWVRPEWDDGPCKLFDAANLAPGSANAKFANGSLFSVEYDPGKRTLSFLLKGDDGKLFSGKGTCDIVSGVWHHVAVTFAPGGEAVAFVDGKKVASASLEGYVPPKGGVQSSGPMLFAFGGDAKTIRTATRLGIRVFTGALDNLRLSSVVCYGGEFTPERSLGKDEHTRSLFRFEAVIDGVSAGADGIVEASILAGEALYPGTAKPKFEKAMPFDVLNYRTVPSERDYLSLSKAYRRTFRLKPGESAKACLPEGVVPDFTEIANNGSEDIVAPFVRHPGEVDPRSYETIRATIGLEGLSDRQKADRLFCYAIRSTDYFIWHPANVMKEKLWTFGHNNKPLRNLNVYGACACGGLNKIASNLFTLCGDLPANAVRGYGHEFEHVLLGGKARVYDLSNQQHFDSLRDDEPASLQEIEREPAIHVRYMKSADHFTRLFAHSPWNSSPDYEQRFFMTLKPGERFRWRRCNDGTFNDVWCVKKGESAPLRHPLAATAPASCPIGNAYLFNRFAPDFANGFVIYEGRTLEKSYAVDFSYTVVRGKYRAEGADGKPRAIELSRDSGKTWKEMPADADGTVRLDYAVRGHYHYVVRAKGGEPSRFRAMTELLMNPRVLTGLARSGENEFCLTAHKGGVVDVTVGWREAAGPIKVSGVAFAGGVRGAERLVAVVDPSSGPTVLDVEGIAAAVVEKGALDAELKGGRLVLSARDADRPFYGLVTLRGENPAARCRLAVLVGRGARLAFVGDGMKGRMLEKAGEKASLRFTPVGPGRFMVFNLTRVPGGLPHTRMGSRPLAQVIDPKARSTRRRLAPCAGTRGANDWYKAAFGEPGSRAAYHWDYAQDPTTAYPNGAPRVWDGTGLDHVDFEMTKDCPGGLELFAVMVIPAGDHAFQGETLKMFTDLSYDPVVVGARWRHRPISCKRRVGWGDF